MSQRSWQARFTSALIIASLLVWRCETLRAQRADDSTHRWAIVAADANARPLADLLTAELSSESNVQLVERDQISRVLDELQLNASGLVQRDRAIRFGKLSQADALVIINCPEAKGQRQQHLRVRLIDTRTSVRLFDAVLKSSDIDAEVAAIRQELQAASATLAIPSEQLRLISVVPIISGEPGHLLKPYCHALTALVAAEFYRRPEFVVLERSDLQRLTAESDLSGLELRLRGATRLLETSVRRTADGKGILATCEIGSPGGGKSASFEIEVPSREPIDARSLIVERVLQAVGQHTGNAEPVAPELEAQTLDRRSRWLRDEESVAMAEAALALARTQERLLAAIGANASLLYRKTIAKQSLESLLADRRRSELRLRYVRAYQPEFPKRTSSPIYYSYANPPVPESDEEKELLLEVSNLRKQILEKELEYTTHAPLDRLDTLLEAIDLEVSWPTNTLDPADRVAELLRAAFSFKRGGRHPPGCESSLLQRNGAVTGRRDRPCCFGRFIGPLDGQ